MALAAVGCACLAVATVACFIRDAPGTAVSTLMIIGAALGVLSLLPRLPARVAVSGLSMEFDSSKELDELLGLLRRELSDDAYDAVMQRLTQASASKETRQEVSQAREGATVESAQTTVEQTLDQLVQRVGVTVERDVVVQVGSRGRPPRVSAVVSCDGRRAVLDFVAQPNRTTVDLAERRLTRALGAQSAGTRAAVVVPTAAQAGAVAVEDPRIDVVASGDLAAWVERQVQGGVRLTGGVLGA